MEEKGIIREVAENEIKVLMQSSPECNGCTACSLDGAHKRILTINQKLDCKVGDEVVINVHPASPYISIFTLFVFPLILVLVSYALADSCLPADLKIKELLTVIISIGGLILGFPFIKLVDGFFKKHENSFLKVKKINQRFSS